MPEQSMKVRNGGGGFVETLEGRRLLTVASVATLPEVNLPAGTTAVQTLDLGNYFNDPAVPAHTVFLNTNFGAIPVQLTPDATPITVANFLKYVDSGRYNNSIFHRSVPGFVIQGGGFQAVSNLTSIPSYGSIANEYSADRLNTRGTIAMAKGAHPDSASSQFFFNLGNNATSLNNTANSGGFTVFGSVIGSGMSVVDAIAAVPVAYDFMGSPFDELPLVGYTPGDTSAQISQLVVVRSATSGASYTVVSDSPAVVNVSVHGDQLTYTPVANGTANITVVATGLDGLPATQKFKVTVGAAEPSSPGTVTPPPVVTPPPGGTPGGNNDGGAPAEPEPAASLKVGKGGAKSITFKDADGTTTTITVAGAGSVTVHLGGTGVTAKNAKGAITVTGGDLSVMELEFAGTNAATVVTFTTKGGNRSVDVEDVTVPGALGTLDAPGVNLVGDMTVGGAVNAIEVKSLASGGSVSAKSVGRFTASGAFGGTLTAGSIRTLSAATITGAMIATTARRTSLGTVTTKNLLDSEIRSAGSIESVTVTGAMKNSRIFAGVAADGDVTAEQAAAGKGQIVSVRVGSGKKGQAFANSTIAAKTIRSASFGNMADAAGDAPFNGLYADVITSATGFVGGKPFAITNATRQSHVDDQLAEDKVKPKNLKILVR